MATNFLSSKEPEYARVDSEEGPDTDRTPTTPRQRWNRSTALVTGANILILIITLSVATTSWKSRCSMNECLKRTSTYSPVFDRGFDPDMQPMVVNGTFYSPEHPSIARQMPNPEADAMWDEIEITRIIPVSGEEVVRMGKDPGTAVKLENDVWGEGEDMYAAVFDMFHQLHCLNAIRFVVYGDYYNQTMGDHTRPRRHHEIHINHCMDILYQTITCSNNVNLLTLHWTEGQEAPFPDMSINRMCYNFPRFLEWRKDNTIDMDMWAKPGLMTKPAGHTEMPWGDNI